MESLCVSVSYSGGVLQNCDAHRLGDGASGWNGLSGAAAVARRVPTSSGDASELARFRPVPARVGQRRCRRRPAVPPCSHRAGPSAAPPRIRRHPPGHGMPKPPLYPAIALFVVGIQPGLGGCGGKPPTAGVGCRARSRSKRVVSPGAWRGCGCASGEAGRRRVFQDRRIRGLRRSRGPVPRNGAHDQRLFVTTLSPAPAIRARRCRPGHRREPAARACRPGRSGWRRGRSGCRCRARRPRWRAAGRWGQAVAGREGVAFDPPVVLENYPLSNWHGGDIAQARTWVAIQAWSVSGSARQGSISPVSCRSGWVSTWLSVQ